MLNDSKWINRKVKVYVDNAQVHYEVNGMLTSLGNKDLEITGHYSFGEIHDQNKSSVIRIPKRNVSLIVREDKGE